MAFRCRPIPARFAEIARTAAADAGFEMQPDLCIMNYYGADAKMGVHQDKDERPETIAAGIPIVSVSLGDAARFVSAACRAGIRRTRCAAVGRRAGDGRAVTPALSRRDPHPPRHRARRHGSGTLQPDVPPVVGIQFQFQLPASSFQLPVVRLPVPVSGCRTSPVAVGQSPVAAVSVQLQFHARALAWDTWRRLRRNAAKGSGVDDRAAPK